MATLRGNGNSSACDSGPITPEELPRLVAVSLACLSSILNPLGQVLMKKALTGAPSPTARGASSTLSQSDEEQGKARLEAGRHMPLLSSVSDGSRSDAYGTAENPGDGGAARWQEECALWNWRWLFAFCVYVTSQALNLFSYAGISQAQNSVIGTSALVWNAIFASAILGESVSRGDLVGISAVIVGAILSLVAAVSVADKIHPPPQTMSAIVASLEQIPFLSFVSMVMIAAMASTLRLSWLSWQSNYDSGKKSTYFVVLASSMGMVSTFCSNAIMKMVASSIHADSWTSACNQFRSIGPWILFAIFVVSIVGSLYFLNQALANANALFVVPFFMVSNTMLGICCGLLFSRPGITLGMGILWAIGGSLEVLGILSISLKDLARRMKQARP